MVTASRLALLLIVMAARCWGVTCSPSDTSGCPATVCPGSGVIAGTAWTEPGHAAITSITAVCNVTYNSNFPTCTGANPSCTVLDVYYPTGAGATTRMAWMPHGGGLNTASRNTPLGGTGPTNAIITAQRLGATVIVMDYRLTGTAIFPAQIQDVKCALYYTVADAGSTIPGDRMNIVGFEASAGALLSSLTALTKGQTFWADSCPTAATSAYRFTAMALISPWLCVASTTACANPTYTHNSGTATTATNTALSCSSAGTCETADNTLQMSPTFWMLDSNANAKVRTFFGYGTTDLTAGHSVNNAGVAPMNDWVATTLYAAFTSPIVTPDNSYAFGHGAGLYNTGIASQVYSDAISFLNSDYAGMSGGVTLSGGVTVR